MTRAHNYDLVIRGGQIVDELLTDRPPHFRNGHRSHWNEKHSISRLDATS